MCKKPNLPIILASSSVSRAMLLKKIHIPISQIITPNINEIPLHNELPNDLAKRLAKSKLEAALFKTEKGYIICADTVAAIGRRILPKAETDDDIRNCLNKLSGRRHRVYTGIAIAKKINPQEIIIKQKLIQTVIKFKRLSLEDINLYIDSKEGINKAGGYSIAGIAECFIQFVNGSISNVIGLPLLETRNILISLGVKHEISIKF